MRQGSPKRALVLSRPLITVDEYANEAPTLSSSLLPEPTWLELHQGEALGPPMEKKAQGGWFYGAIPVTTALYSVILSLEGPWTLGKENTERERPGC